MIKKVLFRGAATTSVATVLYTVPASTKTDVTNILVCNTSASPVTFDLAFNGVKTNATQPLAAYTTVYIGLEQTLDPTQTIAGGASTTAVNFHISGNETV